eukprot:5951709-Amphidinium_carterae.1
MITTSCAVFAAGGAGTLAWFDKMVTATQPRPSTAKHVAQLHRPLVPWHQQHTIALLFWEGFSACNASRI